MLGTETDPVSFIFIVNVFNVQVCVWCGWKENKHNDNKLKNLEEWPAFLCTIAGESSGL